jgi:two-component system sensor kinase FixL
LADQAQRAVDLVRGLRDFAKGTKVDRAPVDLRDIIDRAVVEAMPYLEQHGIVADVKLTKEAVVLGNRTQLGQVVGNLLRNAVEAMQEVPAARRRLSVRSRRAGNDIEFEIMDRGKGISVEGVQALFQPFVSTKAHGTGLGLALTRAIVQAHGGRVWWKDHHGRGASFFVSLPSYTVKEP